MIDLKRFSNIEISKVPPISERLSHGLKTIAMSNYTGPLEASTEIIDNSVDERDPSNPPLLLQINISKDKITFFDSHSLGMGYKELSDFLNWGYSSKLYGSGKIGRYGAGGKGAIGYLGIGCNIRTKRKNEDVIWELNEHNWRDAGLKQFKPIPVRNTSPINVGFTQIDILGVDKKINKKELSRLLSHIYSPLLGANHINIKVGKLKIEPFEFTLDETEPIIQIKEQTKYGIVIGWFGKQVSGTGIRGGIRCYYNGRLITRDYRKVQEFFGHPDPQYLGSMNYLVGEIHLDFVPVLPNKTDFNRASREWEAVEKLIHTKLKPLVDALKNKKEEVTINNEDTKNLEEVQNLVRSAISSYEEHELMGQRSTEGFGEGRKPPERRSETEPDMAGDKDSTDFENDRLPRTPPPSNRVGTLLRSKGFPIFEVRVGDGLNRASLIEEEGMKKIIFDKKFPEYSARDGDVLYKAEAALMQLVKPPSDDIKMPIDGYLNIVDEVMREVIRLHDFKRSKSKEITLEDVIS